MKRALLIVDVQNDFTEGGALGVSGGDDVARGVTALLARSAGEYDRVIASRDWHDADSANGGHISDEPDFIDSWPVHCIAQTSGAEYDPLLDVTAITDHIHKGQGVPAYSLFEGRTSDGATAAEILAEAGITAVDVVGIATDHCVRASVLDARRAGLEVRVFTDLIAGVAAIPSAVAIDEMAAVGAQMAESA